MIVGKETKVHVVPVETVDQLGDGLKKQLKDGQPPEVPLAISCGDMASIAHTLQSYIRIAQEVVEVEVEVESEELEALQEKLKELLGAEAPKQSNLVTP